MPGAGFVSIIIPAFNAAAHIRETLQSVFAQTYTNFEVIVADDGSEDGAALKRVLNAFGNRVTYLRQENQGCGAARNLGLSVARGEFCAFLDSDDIWFANYLAEQTEVFRLAPLTHAVYCNASLFGDDSLVGLSFMDVSPSNGPITLKSLLSERTVVPLSFCLVRRECLDDGGFDSTFRCCEDYDLWLRLSAAGRRFAYHRKILGARRVHPSSLSSDYEAMIHARIRVYEKFAAASDNGGEAATAKAQIAKCQALLGTYRAKQYIRRGEMDRALKELEQTRSIPPIRIRAALRLGSVSPTALRFAFRLADSPYFVAIRLASLRWRARIRRIGSSTLVQDDTS